MKRAILILPMLILPMLLFFIVAFSVIVGAEEVPVNNQISWSEFFYQAPERIFLKNNTLNTLTIRKPYDLEINGESHFFKISSLAVSSVELSFYNLQEPVFLYEGKVEEINVLNEKFTAHLVYVDSDFAVIKFTKYVPPPPVVEELVEDLVETPLEVPVNDNNPEQEDNSENELLENSTVIDINASQNSQYLTSKVDMFGIIFYVVYIMLVLFGGGICYFYYKKNSDAKFPPVLGKLSTKKFKKSKKPKKENLEKISKKQEAKSYIPEQVIEKNIDHKKIFSYDEYEKLKTQLDKEHKGKTKK